MNLKGAALSKTAPGGWLLVFIPISPHIYHPPEEMIRTGK